MKTTTTLLAILALPLNSLATPLPYEIDTGLVQTQATGYNLNGRTDNHDNSLTVNCQDTINYNFREYCAVRGKIPPVRLGSGFFGYSDGASGHAAMIATSSDTVSVLGNTYISVSTNSGVVLVEGEADHRFHTGTTTKTVTANPWENASLYYLNGHGKIYMPRYHVLTSKTAEMVMNISQYSGSGSAMHFRYILNYKKRTAKVTLTPSTTSLTCTAYVGQTCTTKAVELKVSSDMDKTFITLSARSGSNKANPRVVEGSSSKPIASWSKRLTTNVAGQATSVPLRFAYQSNTPQEFKDAVTIEATVQ
ncbi:hypothetical protein [Escherichia coli]|uniref:hypothetical protein n=1 Tax=Escherichia coli TaxID=562 RepID=UPI0003913BE4|nr:hypothetical protein [Escherichia coli]ERB10649.1 hypothetical protein G918_04760 [Escherichia coli UMEA 3150-1]